MQFNTKLNVGDVIWHIARGNIGSSIINGIIIEYKPRSFNHYLIQYNCDDCNVKASDHNKTWWTTREALVKHLLENENPVVTKSKHVELDELPELTQKEKEELDQIGARIMREHDDQQYDNLYELLAILEKKVITPPEQKRRDDLLKTISESDENDLEEILGQPIKSVVQAQKDQDMVNLENWIVAVQESDESNRIRGFAQQTKEEKKNEPSIDEMLADLTKKELDTVEKVLQKGLSDMLKRQIQAEFKAQEKKNELNEAFEDYLQNGSIPTKETIRKANHPSKAYKIGQPTEDDMAADFAKFFDHPPKIEPKTAEQIKIEMEFASLFETKPKEKSLNQLFDEIIGD